jgi:hypothetical protein
MGIIVAVRKCDVVHFQGIAAIFEFGSVAVRTRGAGAREGGKTRGK